MAKIPQELVKSLVELGLLESEAKIYATLAMMNNAEVKKLINFLGISKPNTYESLRLLEEKGLVTLITARPMTYQATPPEIGLEMLFKKHLNAKEKAEELLSKLNEEKFIEKPKETLWYVFGEKSIDYKIKDMVKNTKKSIFLASSCEYLKYFKKLDETETNFDITIFSDSEDAENELKKIFKGKDGNFQVISKKDMINGLINLKSRNLDGELKTYLDEAVQMFDYKHLMVLIVDDSELLYVLPMSEDSLTAINTTSKVFILITKIGLKDIATNSK